MKAIDYIISAIIGVILALIIAYMVWKKKKGEKIGCGCGCQACPHAGACSGAKPTCEKQSGVDRADTKDKGENENDETV